MCLLIKKNLIKTLNHFEVRVLIQNSKIDLAYTIYVHYTDIYIIWYIYVYVICTIYYIV